MPAFPVAAQKPLGNPPPMPTPLDRKRSEHQGLRERMLSGQWLKDMEQALARHFPAERRPYLGPPEISRNPFRSVTSQVGGVLYREPPEVQGDAGSEVTAAQAKAAGLWPLMQNASTDLVGLRELPVRVSWSKRGGLLYRPISPADCWAKASPDAPDVPMLVAERQIRDVPGKSGESQWVWEVLSIEDEDQPFHYVTDADGKRDLTGDYLRNPDGSPLINASGSEYKYRGADGRPFIPIQFRHAERTGRLWNPWFGLEAVLGSLTVGVLMTFWVHGIRDGSFYSVLLINGRIGGVETHDQGQPERSDTIYVEPGSYQEVGPLDPDQTTPPSAVQIRPGFDPLQMIEAISSFEGGLAEYAGVSPSDLIRTHADPRSGISLTVSREGLRAAQARAMPQLARDDAGLMEITAKVLNRCEGLGLPETGYQVTYTTIPLSGQEQRDLREDITEKMDRGLLSVVDAYQRMHPGMERETAIEELARIRDDNQRHGPGPQRQPTLRAL